MSPEMLEIIKFLRIPFLVAYSIIAIGIMVNCEHAEFVQRFNFRPKTLRFKDMLILLLIFPAPIFFGFIYLFIEIFKYIAKFFTSIKKSSEKEITMLVKLFNYEPFNNN